MCHDSFQKYYSLWLRINSISRFPGQKKAKKSIYDSHYLGIDSALDLTWNTDRLTFSRRFDHLEKDAHHGLGALSAVPLHRGELHSHEVVKVLRPERDDEAGYFLPQILIRQQKLFQFWLGAGQTEWILRHLLKFCVLASTGKNLTK